MASTNTRKRTEQRKHGIKTKAEKRLQRIAQAYEEEQAIRGNTCCKIVGSAQALPMPYQAHVGWRDGPGVGAEGDRTMTRGSSGSARETSSSAGRVADKRGQPCVSGYMERVGSAMVLLMVFGWHLDLPQDVYPVRRLMHRPEILRRTRGKD